MISNGVLHGISLYIAFIPKLISECVGFFRLMIPEELCYRVEVLISLNIVRQRRNGQHFADDIVKGIFVSEHVDISIIIRLKFLPEETITGSEN